VWHPYTGVQHHDMAWGDGDKVAMDLPATACVLRRDVDEWATIDPSILGLPVLREKDRESGEG